MKRRKIIWGEEVKEWEILILINYNLYYKKITLKMILRNRKSKKKFITCWIMGANQNKFLANLMVLLQIKVSLKKETRNKCIKVCIQLY